MERVKPLLAQPAKRGRKPGVDLREILNAVATWRGRLRLADCCRTTSRPGDRVLVVRRFVRRLLFRTIHDIALMLDRERCGREASPSAGVLDSQTVKAPAAPQVGGNERRRS